MTDRGKGKKESKELTVVPEHQETRAFETMNPARLKAALEKLHEFQTIVKSTLQEGYHYGTIPGASKPTLLKPGAEALLYLHGYVATGEIIDQVIDWDRPLFSYTIRITVRHAASGTLMGDGVGECNSMEPKYRYRHAAKVCPNCGKEAIIKGKKEYGGGWLCFKKKEGCGAKFIDGDNSIESQADGRVENEDLAELKNTILKMADKRALIGATLKTCCLSAIFTQDIEDMKINGQANPPTEAAKKDGQPHGTVGNGGADPTDDDSAKPTSDKQYGWLKGTIKNSRKKESEILDMLKRIAPDLPIDEETTLPNPRKLNRGQWRVFMGELGVTV